MTATDRPLALQPWAWDTGHDFTLRGWHSVPSGKPLLHFLHGNSFCGRVYEPLLRRLSADFDLWLCDVQGHGDTDLGGRFKGWNLNAALAAEAFDTLRKPFAEVPRMALGHSFGGVLSLLMMSERPDLFQRAAVMDPVIFPAAMALAMTMAEATGMAAHSPLARAARKRRHQWPGRQEAIDSLRGRGTYKGWSEEALAAFGEHALRPAASGDGVELKCPPSREAEVFASAPVGLWSALRRVSTPTLLLHASESFPFIAPSARQLAASNRHVVVEEFPGNHCFMQCDPDGAALRLRTWFSAAA
jgi:pimeloyl-ACP methyl ester carboxylesterase